MATNLWDYEKQKKDSTSERTGLVDTTELHSFLKGSSKKAEKEKKEAAAKASAEADWQSRIKGRNAILASLQTTYGISQAAYDMAKSGDPSFLEEELVNKGFDPTGAAGIAEQATSSLTHGSTEGIFFSSANNVKSLLDKYAPKTVDPTTGAVTFTPIANAAKTKEELLAKAITNRQMSLLQQEMGKQRAQGISSLRGNLAQRGLMDSGSLGAGIGRINRDIGQQTAQGALMANNQEGGTLLNFLQQQKQNQAANRSNWQNRQWQLQDRTWQEGQNAAQRDYEQKQRNKDREAQLWGGLAGAAGNLAGLLF